MPTLSLGARRALAVAAVGVVAALLLLHRGHAAGAPSLQVRPVVAARPGSVAAAAGRPKLMVVDVGPVTAQKIVQYRTQHGAFHAVDELDAIPGIGPARIAQLQGLVVP